MSLKKPMLQIRFLILPFHLNFGKVLSVFQFMYGHKTDRFDHSTY